MDNGLRVVHLLDESTQMVAVNVIYGVGARDEDPDHTGFAHLFEHLMFGGSRHVADFDTPVQMAGGENNAWTNNDVTNYYITIPSQNLETALYLESDRMLELSFDPQGLEIQRSVVMEEFKQRCLNQPYGDVQHLMRPLAYTRHPYRWPTIGRELSHIQDATLEEVRAFFFKYYAPDNAVIGIVGNAQWDEVISLVHKWFDDIPSRGVEKRDYPQEPLQTQMRVMDVERDVPSDALYLTYKMCGRTSMDFYAFDILSDILANGDSSRLVAHLVRNRNLFSQLDCYVDDSLDSGLFHISGRLMPGVGFDKAYSAIEEELSSLRNTPVDKMELEKVRNKFEAAQVFSNMNYQSMAYSLAFFEMMGGAERLFDEVRNYRSVDAEQLMRIARTYLTQEHCSVLRYHARKRDE